MLNDNCPACGSATRATAFLAGVPRRLCINVRCGYVFIDTLELGSAL